MVACKLAPAPANREFHPPSRDRRAVAAPDKVMKRHLQHIPWPGSQADKVERQARKYEGGACKLGASRIK